MTPQLQQAIRLLQLSRLELIDEIRKELDANPVLADEEVDPRARAQRRRQERRGRSHASRARPTRRRMNAEKAAASRPREADRGQAGPGDRLGAVPREPDPPAAPAQQPRRLRGAPPHRAEPHEERVARRPPELAAPAERLHRRRAEVRRARPRQPRRQRLPRPQGHRARERREDAGPHASRTWRARCRLDPEDAECVLRDDAGVGPRRRVLARRCRSACTSRPRSSATTTSSSQSSTSTCTTSRSTTTRRSRAT